jgi:glycosyltransferase involved in cell wall biosynthesis
VPDSARTRIGRYVTRALMLHRYRKALSKIVAIEKPDVIHAHSSYLNALGAVPAARAFGLPLVYEVRTLWGESAVIEDGLQVDSWRYRMVWRLELSAMRNASAVVPIAVGIRDELARKGVPVDKMTVVGNGVDSSKFVARERDAALAAKHGLDGKFVVGFIGTMRRLEGLSTLVQAFAATRARREDIALVLVGDGPDKADLEALAAKHGVRDILFTGTVPHEQVAAWYSVMDVLVYPRIRATINERVTPLKPLEAMALGKACVASDVGGLTELVTDGETGVIFEAGNHEALAQALEGLMEDRPRLAKLARQGTEFVHRERDWSAIIPRTRELYERLRGGAARA